MDVRQPEHVAELVLGRELRMARALLDVEDVHRSLARARAALPELVRVADVQHRVKVGGDRDHPDVHHDLLRLARARAVGDEEVLEAPARLSTA